MLLYELLGFDIKFKLIFMEIINLNSKMYKLDNHLLLEEPISEKK